MSTDPLVARRLGSQLLAGPRARSVTGVVERLLAVQRRTRAGSGSPSGRGRSGWPRPTWTAR